MWWYLKPMMMVACNLWYKNIMHDGYGVNVQRQEMPHPHSAMLSPDEKFLFVANLGNDRLYRYGFDAKMQPTH